MEEEETGNCKNADGDMFTRAQAARGNRHGMEREDVGGRKLLLEEEEFDTSDKGEVLKIMQHLVSHKAPAREHVGGQRWSRRIYG